ncbi:MAG: zf-HC2 domain-containing protein [Spirochaetes bacterium]|uniref:Zf-HC2 domain-containing protein n=1 Tax=Candidatus Ornithospirochaeta stercoripullorum TaxID=2840899 RepID=A0A9D9E0X8_9SPIO|nr:zf-HC2 domain-containing protein [Candidatus Ornithospirochaeta stercoripullorum]
MCIDSQMLSAYLDGELPEPYKTQVEEHLEHCPACRKHLCDMKDLDERIKAASFSDEILLRNKDKIFSLLDKKYFEKGKKISFLRRRLEVSVPSLVTAAAAVVFIFIGGFMFFGTSSDQTKDILPSFAMQADSSNVHYVSDNDGLENYTLEEILQYLDSKGYNVDISIKGLQPLETEPAQN